MHGHQRQCHEQLVLQHGKQVKLRRHDQQVFFGLVVLRHGDRLSGNKPVPLVHCYGRVHRTHTALACQGKDSGGLQMQPDIPFSTRASPQLGICLPVHSQIGL